MKYNIGDCVKLNKAYLAKHPKDKYAEEIAIIIKKDDGQDDGHFDYKIEWLCDKEHGLVYEYEIISCLDPLLSGKFYLI